MTNLDSVSEKQRHHFAGKVPSSQSCGFSNSHMLECESWTIKKAERRRMDALELWCWRRLSARRSLLFTEAAPCFMQPRPAPCFS